MFKVITFVTWNVEILTCGRIHVFMFYVIEMFQDSFSVGVCGLTYILFVALGTRDEIYHIFCFKSVLLGCLIVSPHVGAFIGCRFVSFWAKFTNNAPTCL